MYVHLSSPFLQAVSLHLFYLGRVPFFLVLAGYFLGRNITWNKAFNRAFWLFIPFMFGMYCTCSLSCLMTALPSALRI